MNTTILTIYVLIWPALTTVVMAGLCWGVWKDIRDAKRTGEELV